MRYEAHDQQAGGGLLQMLQTRAVVILTQVRCTNLIFIDLETTSGFYDFEEMPQILEARELDGSCTRTLKLLQVAIIITDRHLNELDRGHWARP